MSQRLIDELRNENLCTHFILPLLKLSKFSFLSSNFIDSYITRDRQAVVVEVVELELLSRRVKENHPRFIGQTWIDGRHLLVYHINSQWKEDIELFISGGFSKMSQRAKDMIIRYSRLAYMQRDEDGKIVTDGRLLALERNPKLKEMWERELDVYLDYQAELLSIPGERAFISL